MALATVSANAITVTRDVGWVGIRRAQESIYWDSKAQRETMDRHHRCLLLMETTLALAIQGDRQMGMKKLLLKIKVLMFEVITQIRSNSDGDCTGVRWFGLSQ